MEQGAKGPIVRAWQRIWGVPTSKVDGDFGPGTLEYAQRWQTKKGLEPTGVVGAAERACLEPGDLIKPFEGLRLHTYDDKDGKNVTWNGVFWDRGEGVTCFGNPTIGWGRKLASGDHTSLCTREQADTWFDEDVLKTRLPRVLTSLSEDDAKDPAKVCAAACFAYNAGTGALSTLAHQSFSKAVWLSFCHAFGAVNLGLVGRREEEFALFADETE